jgi:hypothetical protein
MQAEMSQFYELLPSPFAL